MLLAPPPDTARAPDTAYRRLLEQVRYNGAYPTCERAEHSVRTVLEALGGQLTAVDHARLAARLPDEAARHLGAAPSAGEPLTGRSFVQAIAERMGTRPAVARWDVGTVLSVIGRLAGEPLLPEVLRRLPPGYALLFGRAELTRER